MHLDHVTRQDEHADYEGCEADDPGDAIRAHPFSKKRLTLSAPTVVGQMVSMPSSARSEEHTSELQSQSNLVCRLLLEKKKKYKEKSTKAKYIRSARTQT